MNDTYELDAMIDNILAPEQQEAPAPAKRQRGRQKKAPSPIWALDFHNPDGNRTFALISMCIKDNFDQSIEELSLCIATLKSVSPTTALKILLQLKERGLLGYYDNKTLHFVQWKEKEAYDELENARN